MKSIQWILQHIQMLQSMTYVNCFVFQNILNGIFFSCLSSNDKKGIILCLYQAI